MNLHARFSTVLSILALIQFSQCFLSDLEGIQPKLGSLTKPRPIFHVRSKTSKSSSASSCKEISLKNGRVRYRSRGRFLKFSCMLGYTLAGDRYSSCVNGHWDGIIPKCVRPTCRRIKNPPAKGFFFTNPEYKGAVMTFFCNYGYELRGQAVTYCDGKIWDNPMPNCLETNKPPETSCNFEDGFCGWNHDLNHDFDWERHNGNTPTGHLATGPSYDHTLGKAKKGYYLYTESSSRAVNDKARLFSPIFSTDEKFTCFEFYYHMYGSGTGMLRVYLKPIGLEFGQLRPVFAKYGNQGDVWLRGMVSLANLTQTSYQIIIEGVRGTSYVSDIAIDDVALKFSCEEPATTEQYTTTSSDDLEVNTADEQMYSCRNRCLDEAVTGSPLCECFPSCIDDNTCCPDYISECVLDPDSSTIGSLDTSVQLSNTSVITKQGNNEGTSLQPTVVQTSTIRKLIETISTKNSPEIKTTDLNSAVPEATTINCSLDFNSESSIINFDDSVSPQIHESNDIDHFDRFANVHIPTIAPVRGFEFSPRMNASDVAYYTLIVIAVVSALSIVAIVVIKGKVLFGEEQSNDGTESAHDVNMHYYTCDEVLDFNLQCPTTTCEEAKLL